MVITPGAEAGRLCDRGRLGIMVADEVPAQLAEVEGRSEVRDESDVDGEYVKPRLKLGGWYVTPNSGRVQNGHIAGSEISNSSGPEESWLVVVALGSVESVFSSPGWCSGRCGSGRLILTKHSVQIGC